MMNAKADEPNRIKAYFHCARCLNEWKENNKGDTSPSDYQQIEAGWTDEGLQVWCKRHNLNIIHVHIPTFGEA